MLYINDHLSKLCQAQFFVSKFLKCCEDKTNKGKLLFQGKMGQLVVFFHKIKFFPKRVMSENEAFSIVTQSKLPKSNEVLKTVLPEDINMPFTESLACQKVCFITNHALNTIFRAVFIEYVKFLINYSKHPFSMKNVIFKTLFYSLKSVSAQQSFELVTKTIGTILNSKGFIYEIV